MGMITVRARSVVWFAVGVVVAVLATAVWLSAWSADAAPGDSDTTVVPITSCRLADTRSSTQVGPRSTALGAEETYVVDVQNASTRCAGTVPASATGLLLNVTAVQPTAPTFLSLWDTGPFPGTSSLNPVPGPPVPNAVTTKLADDDTFRIYNRAGTTHVIIDIVGYLTPISLRELAASAGTPGPKGDQGAKGDPGVDAESPARVIWVADDGTGDFTSLSAALASITDASATKPYLIRIAPGVYTEPSSLGLKNHVHIEGSGQGVTVVSCACSTSVATSMAGSTLGAAGPAEIEIRHLTVRNTGGGEISAAIDVSGAGNISLVGVTLVVSGSATVYGYRSTLGTSGTMRTMTVDVDGLLPFLEGCGVSLSASSAALFDVEVDATQVAGVCAEAGSDLRIDGAQIEADAAGISSITAVSVSGVSTADINNTTATAPNSSFSGVGVLVDQSDVVVTNSRLEGSQTGTGLGSNATINPEPDVKIGSSTVSRAGGLNVTCSGVRNLDFKPLDENCDLI